MSDRISSALKVFSSSPDLHCRQNHDPKLLLDVYFQAGAIQEYISDLLDGMQNKFIVFCYHLNVIAAVTEILAKRSTRYVRIAGDVPSDIRAVSQQCIARVVMQRDVVWIV